MFRYLDDGSVVGREEAGRWALEWHSSDCELVEAALARETGADKKAAIDVAAAFFLGFRAEVIGKGKGDPADQ